MTELLEKINIAPARIMLYKRQHFLLALVQKLRSKATVTDLQKIVFLYSMNKKVTYYDFVPYRFGAYSFQLAKDMEFLNANGYITADNKLTESEQYTSAVSVDSSAIEYLRGDALIRKSYELYPYYAIKSEIADRILNDTALQNIYSVKQELSNFEQKLFSIGYEGKSIEQFVNMLLINNVRLLCDIRSVPLSRKFGFSQGKLQHIAESVGISYIHIPSLGIESEQRRSLEAPEDYTNLFTAYKESLASKVLYLQQVFSLLKNNSRIAIMCYEGDPNFCHRNIVKNYLAENYDIESENL